MSAGASPRRGHSSSLRDTALGPMWIPTSTTPCASMPDEFAGIETRGRRPKDGSDKQNIKMLKAICHTCDFVNECLTSALEEEGGRKSHLRHGMRGATTPEERESIARKHRKKEAA